MNKLLLCLCAVLISGCHPNAQKVVAKVDNYPITQEEFNRGYADSAHDSATRIQSRQDFLDNMINQKLILLDAEAHGLDKDKEFLEMIENFWQQSLLTLALKEKSKEGVNLDQWVDGLRKHSKVEINEEYVQ
jgi:hypothetical protein